MSDSNEREKNEFEHVDLGSTRGGARYLFSFIGYVEITSLVDQTRYWKGAKAPKGKLFLAKRVRACSLRRLERTNPTSVFGGFVTWYPILTNLGCVSKSETVHC
jgi:hypothetical protein